MSPTQRSLSELRKRGHTMIQIVEHWIPCSPAGFKGPIIRKDLWGFIDILLIHEGRTIGVQTTSGSNFSARRTKITQDHAKQLSQLKEAGWEIWLHGWAKRGGAGKRKLWTLKEEQL